MRLVALLRNFAVMRTDELPELLTVEEVALELCIAQRTVHHWITDGKLAATKLGKGKTSPYYVTRAEVERVKAAA